MRTAYECVGVVEDQDKGGWPYLLRVRRTKNIYKSKITLFANF